MKNEQPVYYLDSSLLLKRYLVEPGSEQVLKLLGTSSSIYTASLSFAEVLCAFKRSLKTHIINEKIFQDINLNFKTDWSTVNTLDFNHEAQSKVSEILKRVYLRGADTVHLSTALCLKQRDFPVVFGTADKQLYMAAKLMRLEVLDWE